MVGKPGVVLCAVAFAVASFASFASFAPAAAASVPSHYPVGQLGSVRVSGVAGPRVPTGWHSGSYITVSGWSFDPDAKSTSEIVRSYDGPIMRWRNYTKVYRPDVNRAFGLAGSHGYGGRYAVANGVHRICTYQQNIGLGSPDWSNCVVVTVNGSPYGKVDAFTRVNSTTAHLSGWAADPDDTRQSIAVSYTVDGGTAAPITANLARPDVNAAVHIPGSHGFSMSIRLATGRHTVCVQARNIGPTAPSGNLGCKTVTLVRPLTYSQIPITAGWRSDSAGPSQFQVVSCPATGVCAAGGTFFDSSNVGHLGLSHLSGGVWSTIVAPVPPDAAQGPFPTFPQATFTSMSCSSATHCVAVGAYFDQNHYGHGLIETFANGGWSAQEAPLVPGVTTYSQELRSVACPTDGFCIAVGDEDGGRQLIETYAAGSWTASEAPLPAGLSSWSGALESVSCSTAAFCQAAGFMQSGHGTTDGLIETLSGTTWMASVMPLPATPTSVAWSVSVACGPDQTCAAIKTDYDVSSNNGSSHVYLATYSSGSWTGGTFPLPPNFSRWERFSGRSGVACGGSASCVAFTEYDTPTGLRRAAVAQLSGGGTWRSTVAPVPAHAAANNPGFLNSLNDASCAAGGSCELVGTYLGYLGGWSPLVVTLTDGVWSALGAPIPAGTVSEAFGVSCVTSAWCASVGYEYPDVNGATAMPVAWTDRSS